MFNSQHMSNSIAFSGYVHSMVMSIFHMVWLNPGYRGTDAGGNCHAYHAYLPIRL